MQNSKNQRDLRRYLQGNWKIRNFGAMKLIADAGSTKTDWAIIDSVNDVRRFETPGVNALMLSLDDLRAFFANALNGIPAPSLIHYYGAGCASGDICQKVGEALPFSCPKAIDSDLLGAARAALGHEAGVVAILGTGSNCGLYDGREIVGNMPPLGYILGDEGSGTAIGKALLRRIYRSGQEEVRQKFESWLGMDYSEVLDYVYRQPRANTFLASIVPYVKEASMENVAEAEFAEFFAEVRRCFHDSDNRIAIVGGLASAFEEQVRSAAASENLEVTKILSQPIEGLIKFHYYEK